MAFFDLYQTETDTGTHSGRVLYANSLPLDIFQKYLEKITRRYSLDPWEHGPEPGSSMLSLDHSIRCLDNFDLD
jgi:hypothetical protein